MERITIRQIEFAVAIDEAGAICAAAKTLRVAQPSVSQQIAALEKELGIVIFERTAAGSVTTAAGRAFLDGVRPVIAALRQAREMARAVGGVDSGKLSVGVADFVPADRVMRAAARLQDVHPHVSVKVTTYADSDDLVQAVRSGAEDVGMGEVNGTWREHRRILGRHTYRIALPTGHPLAAADVVDRSVLTCRDWVDYPAIRTALASLLADSSNQDVSVSVVSDWQVAAGYVSEGLGITLVPEYLPVPAGVVLREMRPALAHNVHVFALRSASAPWVNEFLSSLQRAPGSSTVRAA